MKNVGILIVGLIALTGVGCEPQGNDLGPLAISVTSDMICRANVPFKTGDPKPESSCIRYSYDGDSVLTIKHLNAGFNCCPESFSTDIEVKGDSLIIREGEMKAGCRCNCLFNLDILVKNLPPDTYHVRFKEPYVENSLQQLVFDLDLKKVPEGEFCVTRPENWWY